MPQTLERHGQALLDSLLADPLIEAVMQADRVDPQELRRLLQHAASLVPAASAESEIEGLAVSLQPDRDPHYRPGVGIALYNKAGEVLVGCRADTEGESWQMPQGGIQPGEAPKAAALRELREEIGTVNVDPLAESKGWLRYDVPAALAERSWGGKWRGQQQKWFAMRFRGTDAEIDVATEHREFIAWRWVPPARAAELIIGFKQQLYKEVLEQFRRADGEAASVAGSG